MVPFYRCTYRAALEELESFFDYFDLPVAELAAEFGELFFEEAELVAEVAGLDAEVDAGLGLGQNFVEAVGLWAGG